MLLLVSTAAVPSRVEGQEQGQVREFTVVGNRYAFAPASLTATPTGHDVAVSWTAGGNGSGYRLLAAANGASSNCTSAMGCVRASETCLVNSISRVLASR